MILIASTETAIVHVLDIFFIMLNYVNYVGVLIIWEIFLFKNKSSSAHAQAPLYSLVVSSIRLHSRSILLIDLICLRYQKYQSIINRFIYYYI